MRPHLRHQDNRIAAKTVMSAQTSGVALLVTLVVLLVLAMLGYNLASRVAAQRHRGNYIIDYTSACYARDSALKYALTILHDLNDITAIPRPNEPDFSDLFALSEQEYRRLLEQWAAEIIRNQTEAASDANYKPYPYLEDFNEASDADYKNPAEPNTKGLKSSWDANDINDTNAVEPNAIQSKTPISGEPNLLESLTIPGPYGPPWPLVAEPAEFEIGPCTVKIEIEDENAKYPLGWAVPDDARPRREAEASVETFCEWMGFDADRIKSLKDQLKQVGSIKPFKVDFKPIVQRIPYPTYTTARGRRRRRRRAAYKTVTILPSEQLIKQARDYSRLFHSSIIDTEMLALPTIVSEQRKESALKYTSLWGTTQVNVNSAPRHVLEAAFTFCGDADRIADEIIKKRREKPFANIDELKNKLFGFSDKIEKCRPYISTTSDTFTIRVTATSGTAKTSAIIVVFRAPGQISKVAMMSG